MGIGRATRRNISSSLNKTFLETQIFAKPTTLLKLFFREIKVIVKKWLIKIIITYSGEKEVMIITFLCPSEQWGDLGGVKIDDAIEVQLTSEPEWSINYQDNEGHYSSFFSSSSVKIEPQMIQIFPNSNIYKIVGKIEEEYYTKKIQTTSYRVKSVVPLRIYERSYEEGNKRKINTYFAGICHLYGLISFDVSHTRAPIKGRVIEINWDLYKIDLNDRFFSQEELPLITIDVDNKLKTINNIFYP